MYMLLCRGGFGVPMSKGKKELLGILATVNDTGAVSRLSVIDTDSDALISASAENTSVVIDLKGAIGDQNLGGFFPEPIPLRKGISLGYATNLIVGSVKAYVR